MKPCGCETETSCECKSTNTPSLRFKVGDKVQHPLDGIGTIVDVDSGCKSVMLYRIDFEDGSSLWRSPDGLMAVNPPPPSPSSILTEAESIVSGRDATYGTPERNLERIAARWSTVFGHPVSVEQVCICMIDVKLSRLTQTPGHRDSLVDVVGYARLYEVTREGK